MVSDSSFPKAWLAAGLCAAFALAACGRSQDPPAGAASSPPPAATQPADAEPSRPAPGGQPRAAATVTITDADDGRAVALQRGQVVELRLKANRTAGFTWIPVQNVLPVMNTDGVPLYESEGDDTAGTEIWRFIALEPGHAHLVFEYRRPFEPGAPPQKSITLHFDVE
ncbi:MAG TPA: protease inhibitor I42 family protein [Gammaproteobacteria bacterium]|nr:protease inhibitor I42 family protein [Gammaproteobacteria bacterium]